MNRLSIFMISCLSCDDAQWSGFSGSDYKYLKLNHDLFHETGKSLKINYPKYEPG